MPEQCRKIFELVAAGLGRVVRVNAHRRQKSGMAIRQPNARFKIGWAVARADRDHQSDAGIERPLDGLLAIGVELPAIEMAVRIDQAHFNRAPTETSSRKLARTGLPPSMDAATIIPFDSSPRSL